MIDISKIIDVANEIKCEQLLARAKLFVYMNEHSNLVLTYEIDRTGSTAISQRVLDVGELKSFRGDYLLLVRQRCMLLARDLNSCIKN